jgi:hypothetical protein
VVAIRTSAKITMDQCNPPRSFPSLARSFAFVLIAGWGIFSFAQSHARDARDYADNETGSSAGGKWTVFRSEDRMTAAKRVRLELPAESAPDSDEQAKIILYCTDGKLSLADFRPNVRLSRPNWPGFWGQPQMRVTVRVDDAHSDHSWNWVNGHFLAMDKGTTRDLIGARLFRIEFQTPDGSQIAEFSPVGLDRGLAEKACGLKPKKP